MTFYTDLGVSEDATEDEITKAYRKKAMKAHPDRGGKDEDFHPIQRAYEVLSNAERRQRYDETGEGDEAQNPRNQLLHHLATLILSLIDSGDVEHTDILAQAMQQVLAQKSNFEQGIATASAKMRKRERAVKRLTKKDGGDSLIAQLVSAEIENVKRQIESIRDNMKIADEMLAVLREYEYKVDPQQQANALFAQFVNVGQYGGWQR